MADHTHIEWTDATWNVVTGCSVVSPGCTNCYAMRLAGTRLRHHPSRAGLTVDSKAGPVWNGQVRFNEAWLTQPLRWRRPRRIFVAAHSDLFHEGVADDQLDRIFAVMALCPQHTFQVLTKRPERMRAYLTAPETRFRVARAIDALRPHLPKNLRKEADRAFWDLTRREGVMEGRWPLPNVWLGVSVEDQARANERIPELMATPAAVRWISAEPLLGPVNLNAIWVRRPGGGESLWDCLRPFGGQQIHWVVAGGESGPGARPMHPDWSRQLRDQCAAAGVPFLFKQWGDWAPDSGPLANGRDPIFTARAACATWAVDAWSHWTDGFAPPAGTPGPWLYRLGKAAAGRLLDGQLHDAYPEAHHV